MKFLIVPIVANLSLTLVAMAEPQTDNDVVQKPITLRAAGVSNNYHQFLSPILEQFRQNFPNINPVYPGGLNIGGNQRNVMMEVLPLMQIAGGVQPDVLELSTDVCAKYVYQRFLYPLDKYIARVLGTQIKDSHLLDLDDFTGLAYL